MLVSFYTIRTQQLVGRESRSGFINSERDRQTIDFSEGITAIVSGLPDWNASPSLTNTSNSSDQMCWLNRFSIPKYNDFLHN